MDTDAMLRELQSKASFPAEEFPAFLALFEQRILPKKHHLYQCGDIARYATFVVKGCMRYYYINEEGNEQIIYFPTENWWVGDLVSLHTNTPTKFCLEALEDCELLIIERENFQKALAEFSGFREYYRLGTQKKDTVTQERLGQLVTDNAEKKYVRLCKERPDLIQRVPQHHIASYLGVTPETLSRIRKKLIP